MLPEQDFILGLEDYKQKTDLFPHIEQPCQQNKKQARLVHKTGKSVKNSKLAFKQKIKE